MFELEIVLSVARLPLYTAETDVFADALNADVGEPAEVLTGKLRGVSLLSVEDAFFVTENEGREETRLDMRLRGEATRLLADETDGDVVIRFTTLELAALFSADSSNLLVIVCFDSEAFGVETIGIF